MLFKELREVYSLLPETVNPAILPEVTVSAPVFDSLLYVESHQNCPARTSAQKIVLPPLLTRRLPAVMWSAFSPMAYTVLRMALPHLSRP